MGLVPRASRIFVPAVLLIIFAFIVRSFFVSPAADVCWKTVLEELVLEELLVSKSVLVWFRTLIHNG